MRYWETKDFKALYKIFEQKLKEGGFIDAERTIDGKRMLIQYSSNVYRQAPAVDREAQIDYYSLVGEYIEKTVFKTKLDERIMRLVADGEKISEIVRKINTTGIYVHRQTVRFIIRRYENKWKIKNWNSKQMYKKVLIP